MLNRILFVLACTSTFALQAHAASVMKAGLWEFTTQSGMMKNMPKMSSEQIEQMRKMGIDMAQLQSGVIVSKVCVTREMAARAELPQLNHTEAGCEARNQKRNSTGYTMDIICDGPSLKGKGVLTTVFASDESFSSSSDFSGTVQGVPVSDTTATGGRWLGAACGSVQPLPELMPGK